MINKTFAKTLLPLIVLIILSVGYDTLAKYYHWWPHEERYIPAVDLEQAVHKANLTRTQGYFNGELAVEGHVILGSETKENITTVYTVSDWGWFAFENGVFTMISGAFRVPTVITFTKDDKGEYVLQNYHEPLNGELSMGSIKKMFPSKYLNDANHTDKFNDDLVKQLEFQASEYLKGIGRIANVSASPVEKTLSKIDVEASNKLLAKMNDFPYWLGTSERLEDGTRYVYETSQSKTADGYDLMIYTKKSSDGKIVAIYRYKIVGSEVVLQ